MQTSRVLTSSLSNEWYTPDHIIERAHRLMGGIDLDPASCEQAQQTVNAGAYYTQEDDGLSKPWHGRVWCNPPYGRRTKESHPPPHGYNAALWAKKMRDEYASRRVWQGLLLTGASTSSRWFHALQDRPYLILRGRIQFSRPGGGGGSNTRDSVIWYFGFNNLGFGRHFGNLGRIVWPTTQ
jgi:phage N-6-adenine-methyltransferase